MLHPLFLTNGHRLLIRLSRRDELFVAVFGGDSIFDLTGRRSDYSVGHLFQTSAPSKNRSLVPNRSPAKPSHLVDDVPRIVRNHQRRRGRTRSAF